MMMMNWCLMSSDISWHIRDTRLWPGNAEARFNIFLRPREPEGSLGRTAQDGHLDSHTAPELWRQLFLFFIFCPHWRTFVSVTDWPCGLNRHWLTQYQHQGLQNCADGNNRKNPPKKQNKKKNPQQQQTNKQKKKKKKKRRKKEI